MESTGTTESETKTPASDEQLQEQTENAGAGKCSECGDLWTTCLATRRHAGVPDERDPSVTTWETLAGEQRAAGLGDDGLPTGEPVDRLGSRALLQSEQDRAQLEQRDRDRAVTFAEVAAGTADEPAGDQLGTYAAMLNDYLHEQRHWIGPAQTPLVFHLRKIGQQLDANPGAPASLSSAYLQAFHRLDRQRPGHKEPAGAAGDLPGQGSIFDELDES